MLDQNTLHQDVRRWRMSEGLAEQDSGVGGYALMAHILVQGVEEAATRGVTIDESLHQVASEEGRAAAASIAPAQRATHARDLEALSRALAGHGYQPEPGVEGELVLVTCPFDTLARSHTALVCALNQSFVRGVVEGLGCSEVDAALEPHVSYCCVRGRLHDEPGV